MAVQQKEKSRQKRDARSHDAENPQWHRAHDREVHLRQQVSTTGTIAARKS